jgi:hypothetical protein
MRDKKYALAGLMGNLFFPFAGGAAIGMWITGGVVRFFRDRMQKGN